MREQQVIEEIVVRDFAGVLSELDIVSGEAVELITIPAGTRVLSSYEDDGDLVVVCETPGGEKPKVSIGVTGDLTDGMRMSPWSTD